MMDEGKILIVNLSKGLIGEDNAGILGAFIVTKIQLAAMSRSDIPNIEDRRPFYLYVDEFQNFATDSFATILSEARKYGLNLTVANQYISQMSDTVRDAVFGNVGSMISFRVSADDAPFLVKQFEPQFEATDLLQMHNRNFIINMVIGGEKTPAFSATTLALPTATHDYLEQIVANSRALYSRDRAEVQEEIRARISSSQPQPQAPRPVAPKQWPISGGSRVKTEPTGQVPRQATPTPLQSTPPTQSEQHDEIDIPKKKRTRSRSRRKPGAEQGGESIASTPTHLPIPRKAPADHELRIR